MDSHLPVLARCVGPRDTSVLVARCTRSGATGTYALMLTRRRLVVTARSRILRRLSLHLNFALNQLTDVSWAVEADGVELAATAIDGVREHFRIEAANVDHVDALLTEVFRAVAPPVLAA
jgi:hypothetical protein